MGCKDDSIDILADDFRCYFQRSELLESFQDIVYCDIGRFYGY